MSRSVSNTLKEQVFSQEMTDPAIVLITISHNDLSEDIYVSDDPTETLASGFRGTVSNGVDYTHLPFELSLAEQSDNLLSRARLKIDNVNREIILAVRAASNEPPLVNIKIVLASDPNAVEFEIPDLRLNDIRANALIVEGDLQPEIFQSEKFPKNSVNQADFPAVFGG